MYVGFGSLRVDNPKGLTKMILGAAKRSGHRLLIARCCPRPFAYLIMCFILS